MCDTIGRIIDNNHALFAKNSDRSANEPQVIEFIEHKHHDEKKLKCTYITIDQVKETNAMVLSRPTWLWGGEMGVNEYGVCIGNEAVFTKGKYGEDSLIGMDLLRLGLERGNSAFEALNVIIELLEKYNQGGNCGYDKDFHYDNSFLIMDRKQLFVLETYRNKWVYKQYDRASISNRLTIEDDGDKYSDERCNFKKTYSDFLFSTFSYASKRRQCTSTHKFDDIYDAFATLRQHTNDSPMSKASVSSVCMHAGDAFADQTTSSMVVELDDDIHIYVTGCSRPCISVFKPYEFKQDGIIGPENSDGAYWKKMELMQRKMLGKKIPQQFYIEKDELEKRIIENRNKDTLKLEEQFYDKWNKYNFQDDKCLSEFKNYWKKKNASFK